MFDESFAKINKEKQTQFFFEDIADQMITENADIFLITQGLKSFSKSIFQLDCKNDPAKHLPNLKSGELLMGTVFGSQNIEELANAFIKIEEKYNIFIPRRNPCFSIQSLGNLLVANDFEKIVIESIEIKKEFSDIKKAMHFIKQNGKNIALNERSKLTQKNIFLALVNSNLHNFDLTFKILSFSCFKK